MSFLEKQVDFKFLKTDLKKEEIYKNIQCNGVFIRSKKLTQYIHYFIYVNQFRFGIRSCIKCEWRERVVKLE
jgi:hypothetical protein